MIHLTEYNKFTDKSVKYITNDIIKMIESNSNDLYSELYKIFLSDDCNDILLSLIPFLIEHEYVTIYEYIIDHYNPSLIHYLTNTDNINDHNFKIIGKFLRIYFDKYKNNNEVSWFWDMIVKYIYRNEYSLLFVQELIAITNYREELIINIIELLDELNNMKSIKLLNYIKKQYSNDYKKARSKKFNL